MEQHNLIFGLDIGTRTVIGTLGYMEDKQWHVLHHVCMEHEERAMLDGQVHDIEKVAHTVQQVKEALESQVEEPLTTVNIAAAGRTLSTQVVTVSKTFEELHEMDIIDLQNLQMKGIDQAKAMLETDCVEKAHEYFCVGHTVMHYFVDDYMISNPEGHKGKVLSAQILATFLPKSVVDGLYAVINRVGLEVAYLTLEPIAAINAIIPENIRLLNLALVDIGAGTSDIAITKEGSVGAYGMIPMAGDEITETLVHKYLVDFNTAEKMKQQMGVQEEVEYEDIIGLTNTVSSKELIECVEPIIKKLAQQIAKKILELNGRKATNAVFCIGGGSQMTGLIEHLANELKLPIQRVSLRLATQIPDVIYKCEMTKGPEMITPLGIAMTAARSKQDQFVNMMLNNEPITLFNTKKLTVLDALLHIGTKHEQIFPRKGKTLMFKYNDERIRIKGEIGEAAIMHLNNQPASLETPIKEGDSLHIVYATPGGDATALLEDYINEEVRWMIEVDGVQMKLPIILVNGDIEDMSYQIQEGDKIQVVQIKTVRDLLDLLQISDDEKIIKINGKEVEDMALLYPGDKVLMQSKGEPIKELKANKVEQAEAEQIEVEQVGVRVRVNGEEIYLPPKEEPYMFVHIFDFINFDLSQPQGTIQLKLNKEDASVTDTIKAGDEIEIYWKK